MQNVQYVDWEKIFEIWLNDKSDRMFENPIEQNVSDSNSYTNFNPNQDFLHSNKQHLWRPIAAAALPGY